MRKVRGIRKDGSRRGVDNTRRLQRTPPRREKNIIERPFSGIYVEELDIVPTDKESGGRVGALLLLGVVLAVSMVGLMNAVAGEPCCVVRMRQAN